MKGLRYGGPVLGFASRSVLHVRLMRMDNGAYNQTRDITAPDLCLFRCVGHFRNVLCTSAF